MKGIQTHKLTDTNLQKEGNTFRSYFKFKAMALFANVLRKFSCWCDGIPPGPLKDKVAFVL